MAFFSIACLFAHLAHFALAQEPAAHDGLLFAAPDEAGRFAWTLPAEDASPHFAGVIDARGELSARLVVEGAPCARIFATRPGSGLAMFFVDYEDAPRLGSLVVFREGARTTSVEASDPSPEACRALETSACLLAARRALCDALFECTVAANPFLPA